MLKNKRKRLYGLVVLASIALFSLNGLYVYQLFKYISPIPVVTNQVSRDEYIAKYRPEHFVLKYANHRLENGVKILGLFLGNRRYYSKHAILFDIDGFGRLVKESVSEYDLKSKLQQFSHLIVNHSKFNHWSEMTFDEKERERVMRFFNNQTVKVYSNAGHGLYAIKEKKNYPQSDDLANSSAI